MNVSFLFHLYQPSFQSESVLRDIYNKCYNPLLKLIKSHKNFNVTLNIPLSLLEQLDKYGYGAWIESVEELVEIGKIELTGSGAYHPLLTKVSSLVAEKQIILNEYALGYYFGKRNGFEGEPSILIKNLNGFFPPELAVNEQLVRLADDLGYKWLLADETALPNSVLNSNVFSLPDIQTKVVVRDKDLSNIISFKRTFDIADVWQYMQEKRKLTYIVALDGETFGHHFKDGIAWLELFLDYLMLHNVSVMTVTEVIEDMSEHAIDTVVESSWGASMEEMANGDGYPMWDIEGNDIQKLQWEILVDMCLVAEQAPSAVSNTPNLYETAPVWKITDITDPVLKAANTDIQLQKLFNSDQFWWSSKKTLPYGKVLYDAPILKGIVHMYREYLAGVTSELAAKINDKLDRLEKLL